MPPLTWFSLYEGLPGGEADAEDRASEQQHDEEESARELLEHRIALLRAHDVVDDLAHPAHIRQRVCLRTLNGAGKGALGWRAGRGSA